MLENVIGDEEVKCRVRINAEIVAINHMRERHQAVRRLSVISNKLLIGKDINIFDGGLWSDIGWHVLGTDFHAVTAKMTGSIMITQRQATLKT